MSLATSFSVIRPSIVALCVPPRPDIRTALPTIVGTGFVVDSRGIVVTNRHVAAELRRHAPRDAKPPDAAYAILFGTVRPEGDTYAQTLTFATVRRILAVKDISLPGRFFAPIPDLAFLTLDVGEIPAVTLAPPGDNWQPGLDIATAGFALGAEGLALYNNMNQFVPFLRKGIISSVFPFPGPSPHGFTIDVMTQGGESGSPIFRCEDGVVIGVLYAGFDATNITFGIPSSILADTVEQVISVFDVRFDNLRSWRRAQELEHQGGLTKRPDQSPGETA